MNKHNEIDSLEKYIAHYQEEAAKIKKAADIAYGEEKTVSVYKWMHSLWRTVCEFVEVLDSLSYKCEIVEYAENCEDCGFCNKGGASDGRNDTPP